MGAARSEQQRAVVAYKYIYDRLQQQLMYSKPHGDGTATASSSNGCQTTKKGKEKRNTTSTYLPELCSFVCLCFSRGKVPKGDSDGSHCDAKPKTDMALRCPIYWFLFIFYY